MKKLAERVVAVMKDAELEALIDDRCQGESQTLTGGAEQNLLKLAELRGRMALGAGCGPTSGRRDLAGQRRSSRICTFAVSA